MRKKLTTQELNNRLDAIQDELARTPRNYKITSHQVELLLDMALNGDIPNGRFSDVECNIWSIMRRVLQNNGIECASI